jgi:hypothetical protein
MYTDKAAEIAKKRHALLQQFTDALKDETDNSLSLPF